MGSHHARILEVPPVTQRGDSSPLTPATVALNIASHRDELFRLNPGAVELAAACVFAFHEDVNGSLTTVLASRNGSYAREQGTGKRSLTVEDICEMATRGGAEGRSAVRALLGPILSRLDDAGSGVEVVGAAADFLSEAADVPNAVMLGKSTSQIRTEIREAREKLRILESALDARDRASAPLASVLPGSRVISGGRQ